MKKLFTLLILFTALNSFSQRTVSLKDFEFSSKTIAFTDTVGNQIQLVNDSILIIEGDTTAILKYVIVKYTELLSDQMELENKLRQLEYTIKEYINKQKRYKK